MSPIDELRMFGWAIGAGLFLSLLGGAALRWRTWRRERRERPLTDWLLTWQRAVDAEARRLWRRNK